MGMRSRRDDTWLTMALQLLMRVLMNFTVGMCMALLQFLYLLGKLCYSYKSGIAGVFFFITAGTAACSVVATFLLGLYSAGSIVTFTVVKQAALADRRQGGGRHYTPRRNLRD